MEKVKKAIIKAFELHNGQTRKDSKFPYVVHILDAGKYLMYETNDEEVICAGILHDTLEDTNYTKEELKQEFGSKVYKLVMFCTEPGNTFDANENEQKNSWKSRKEHSIESLTNGSEDELKVFLADKLSNLLSMKEDLINGIDLWNKFNAPKEEIKWYYFSIRDKMMPKLNKTRMYKIYLNLLKEVFE